jgi:drug/metabolite transporter (DMT)-like permease
LLPEALPAAQISRPGSIATHGSQDQTLRGFLLVILSSVCFAAMAIMAKKLHGQVPVWELTFYRGVFGLVPLTAVLWMQRISWKAQDWPILVSRGIWGLLATFCYFWAIQRIPLALAVLLNYTSPIFTAFFAVAFLREKMRGASLGFLLVSMAGLCVLLHPGFHADWKGYAVGLSAGILSGAAYATVKHLTYRTSPWLIVWSFNSIISLGSLPGLLQGGPRKTSAEWFWLVCISLAGTLGQILMAFGFRQTPVSRSSVATLFVLILTTLAGWRWWGETPSINALVGMAAIFVSIIGLGAQKSIEAPR